jgi:hypothetical protein
MGRWLHVWLDGWAARRQTLFLRIIVQVRSAMPLMLDAAHDESAIQLDAAIEKTRASRKEARMRVVYLHRLNTPVKAPKLHPVIMPFLACC